MTARYLLRLEYDGRPFCGWQRQDNGPSVQAALEAAAEKLCGAPVTAHAAGRTDAGVHALAMAAHVDLPRAFAPDEVMGALNAHLRPDPVGVIAATAVTTDLHARFSCYRRHYLYRLLPRRAPAPLKAYRVWAVHQPLDVAAMADAAAALIGNHDFTAFRAAQCQAKSPVKTMETVSVDRFDDEIHVRLSAPSFLHNQVRSIVGSLAQIGLGRWPPGRLADILESRDRSACGPVAPAHGLYFVAADYPADLLAA